MAPNTGGEAARAGDAGKGFAIAAQEVRELASRSARAANEIKALVSASTAKVANGLTLVNRIGTALTEIEEQVRGVTGLIIVSTASEQAMAVSDINASVTSLDQVTQKNAAMAVETTAASHALGNEAHILEDVVSRFSAYSNVQRNLSRVA